MKNKKTDWFVYNRYWRQWSRVMLRGGGTFDHEVRIPLHPINDHPEYVSEKDWADIAKVQIEKFDVRYRASTNDLTYTHELPQEVYDRLVMMTGKATANIIMHGDLLPMIDWSRHAECGDSYVPFELCRVEQSWLFHTVTKEAGGTITGFMDADRFKTMMALDVPKCCQLAGGVYHEHGDTTVRAVSMIDISREVVTVEFLISSPSFDTSTRFVNNIRSDWNPAIYSYLVDNDEVNVETNAAILDMIAKIRNNLVIYS